MIKRYRKQNYAAGGDMKRSCSVSLIIAASILLFTTRGIGEENKPIRHWYRLEIQTGDSTYQCMGSSTLDEKEFAKQLAGEDYIVLDDVEYIDSMGKIKKWQEWDPKALPRLYVNPDYVIFFNPMKDDPRKSPSAGPARK
jgi:hypothetical protein